jgi:transcriptional regulator with XRE-family HTH domain
VFLTDGKQLVNLNGLAFQQIQKYENTINRVSPSRLYRLARLLKIPVGYFFEGLPRGVTDATAANDHNVLGDHALHRLETLQFVAAYYRIADLKRRRAVYQFLRAMTEPPPS